MKKIKGTKASEVLFGTDNSDWIEGKGGNDTLYGLAGDDTLNGGGGWDAAGFSDDARNYDFTYSHGRWSVTHARGSGADGTDTLKHIEKLTFADGAVYLDGRNNAPIAAADAATVGEDGPPVVVDLLTNDWDFEGDPLTVTAVDSTATVGTVTLNADGTVTYDPNGQFEYLGENETATDRFSYTVFDGDLTDAATCAVEIQGQNDAPHSLTLSKHCVEPGVPGAVFGSLGVMDSDLTDRHHYSLLSPDDRFEIVGETLKLKDGYSLGPAEVVWLDVQGEDAAGAETHSELYLVGVRGPQGTDGNDTLFGIDGQNAICAGAGNDYVDLSQQGRIWDRSWVFGEGGNDTLYGGRGSDDHLYGGEGDDRIIDWGSRNYLYGGEGDDRIIHWGSRNYLDGGTGNDFLQGGAEDTIIGGSGNDTLIGPDGYATELFGGDGNDILVGWYWGFRNLTGGSGQDTFVVYHEHSHSSRDLVLDFATGPGGDVLDYSEYIDGYRFPQDLNPFSAGFLKFENYSDDGYDGYALVVDKESPGSPFVSNIVLFGVDPASIIPENLFPVFDPWAIAQDQMIVGTDGFDDLHGDGGNDTIFGLGGNDNLWGWAGDDLLQGGPGSDALSGGDGNDILEGGPGSDHLSGGEGNDILEGGAGNDILYGDRLLGYGNRWGDLFRFEGAFGSDSIGDFGFGDHISISTDLAADFPSLDTNGNGVLDDGDAGVAVTAFDTVITFDTGSILVRTQTQLEADDFLFT